MTKKDYIAIAKAIHKSRLLPGSTLDINVLVFELCNLFENDNALFNKERFTGYIKGLEDSR